MAKRDLGAGAMAELAEGEIKVEINPEEVEAVVVTCWAEEATRPF
jgi:hypothetical protein